MKTINFVGTPDFEEIANTGIILICDEDMNLTISDEDYIRLEREFPAAYMDSYEVED